MTDRVARRGIVGWVRTVWRCQRGFGILEALAIAALIASGYAAYEAMSKKVPALQGALIPLRQCRALVNAAMEGLQCTYGRYEVEGNCNSRFLGYPPGLEVPANDAAIIQLHSCKAELDKLNASQKAGNFRAISEISDQIDAGLALSGKCEITSAFRQGTAGVDYRDSFTAHIPFRGSLQHSATVSVTGAAAGTGSFRPNPSQPQNWIGDVVVSSASNQNAGGGSSQVTVTATTPAVAPRQGGCGGATIEDNNQCVYIVRQDGTCPAGLTPKDGRCYFSCTTPAATISWKKPDPAKVELFTVSPSSIEKGSKDPVTLRWAVSNAAVASIDQGIGAVGPVDPTKKNLIGSWLVVPTPEESTTYTISTFGPNQQSSDSKSATLIVKEPPAGAFTVSIGTPNPNEEITDQGVTVSGIVTPVPDVSHRKAQILVNGALLSEATINDAGAFAVRTALLNTITVNDLILFGAPSVAVSQCGSLALPISLGAFAPSAKNLIQVRVPLENGAASASVQVDHVVFATGFHVRWSGDCPGPPQDDSAQAVIRNGESSMTVGHVFCGFSGPVHCNATTAAITVNTSVGPKTAAQGWTANIDSCQ